MASSTVFVSNFPFATTEEELRARFEELSAVRSVRIIVDRETGRSRGFAFVELVDPAAVDDVITALEGSEHKGRRLAVSRARGRAAGGAGGDAAPGARADARSTPAREDAPFRHRIEIAWSDDAGAYTATALELGFSVQGATIDAAVRALRERVAREVEGAHEGE